MSVLSQSELAQRFVARREVPFSPIDNLNWMLQRYYSSTVKRSVIPCSEFNGLTDTREEREALYAAIDAAGWRIAYVGNHMFFELKIVSNYFFICPKFFHRTS